MNHFSLDLSLLAMIPGLFLCGYVLYKDRVEREPILLLALLLGAGAVAYVPAYFLQALAIWGIDSLFAGEMAFSPEGYLTFSSTGAEFLHRTLCAVFGYSLIQTVLKWSVLYAGTRKNKHFNYLFDGVVYSVFLSLGFAVAENIHFALQNETSLVMAKLLTSIPCHLFVGILMGYYYTMWHIRFLANGIENKMLAKGLVKEDKIRSSAGWLAGSILLPSVVNALYVLAASARNQTMIMIFYAAVFILYGTSFVAVDQLAAKECKSARFLCRVIAKGHPELTQQQIEGIVYEEDGQ